MTEIRNWSQMQEMSERLLQERTDMSLTDWKKRIAQFHPVDERSMREWLNAQGVTGYAQTMLVMQTFGYPDFMTASAEELINAQFADRLGLRSIFDAILNTAASLGQVTIQARKTYVSLVTPRRTFARIQATTRSRIDVALRLDSATAGSRLVPSRIHETMKVQVSCTTLADWDEEAQRYLQQAYLESL